MDASLGKRIAQGRRALGLTQEQLAAALGVSAPAVSKWEQGRTCPDIALLAPLARALHTNLDALLEFHASLNEEEVNKLEEGLSHRFEAEGFSSGMAALETLLREYPNSAYLKFRAAAILQRFLPFMEDGRAETVQAIMRKIMDLHRAVIESGEARLAATSMAVLASEHMALGELDEAEALLATLPKPDVDPMELYPSLHMMKGEYDRAEALHQQNLYRAVSKAVTAISALTVIARQRGDTDRALRLSNRQEQLAALMEYPDFMGGILRLALYTEARERVRALDVLEHTVECALEFSFRFDHTLCFPTISQEHYRMSADTYRRMLAGILEKEAAALADEPRYLAAMERLRCAHGV